MMTEAEARTKWCPYARSIATFSVTPPGSLEQLAWLVAGNRVAASPFAGAASVLNPESCRCIASDCMGWEREWGSSDDAKRGFCRLMRRPGDGDDPTFPF